MVKLNYIPTADMRADRMTKSLTEKLHRQHMKTVVFSVCEFVFYFVNLSNLNLDNFVFHCSNNNLMIVLF